MSDDVVISVRGEASTVVAPNVAHIACSLRALGTDKSSALAAVAAALDAVEAGLARLGGVVISREDDRAPLTWVASSTNSRDETYWDRHADAERSTGNVIAAVTLQVRVRDLPLLDAVSDVLGKHDAAHIEYVGWTVDDDNPAWPRVRADAIRAALHRARDYAAALGGTVANVEHIADSGLLAHSGDEQPARFQREMAAVGRESGDTPSLDPEPQRLSAVIEARVVATVPELSL